MKIPAVVLPSHTIGLAVIRSLGEMGVPVIAIYYEKTDEGYVSRYVRERIYTPHPERYEDRFLDLLIQYGKHLGTGLLIPVDDATLTVVSRHKDLLRKHFIVACPEWHITERFVDKRYTYALAESLGIPSPRTIIPESLEDVERYGRAIEYPCIVKPCLSHKYFEIFHRKMVKVENLEEMISAYRQAKNAGLDVMLQEFIPGDDAQGVNYNSYFWDGRPLVEFTAEKVRLAPPGFGVPRVVISKDIPEIIEPGRKLLRALGFYGYSCIEFKKDVRDGVYKLMEINGRHNRSALLSVRCGINFPYIEYRHLVLGELPSACNYQKGVYWIDEFKDVIHTAKYFNKERYPLIQYIRPYIKPHIFATFNRKDPMPFIKRCADLIKKVFRHVPFFKSDETDMRYGN